MHVAEVLEHRFGRQCFGQNTGARHHNFVELSCGNGVERSRNIDQMRLTGGVLNLSGGNVGQRAHVREFGADGMSFPGHFRRALRRVEGGEVERARAGSVRNEGEHVVVARWTPPQSGFRVALSASRRRARGVVKKRFSHGEAQSSR